MWLFFVVIVVVICVFTFGCVVLVFSFFVVGITLVTLVCEVVVEIVVDWVFLVIRFFERRDLRVFSVLRMTVIVSVLLISLLVSSVLMVFWLLYIVVSVFSIICTDRSVYVDIFCVNIWWVVFIRDCSVFRTLFGRWL